MVLPRQAQLQHLNGDTTGVGSGNDVVSLTGTAGVVNAQSARIGNLADPVGQQDAASKEYVDGYFFDNPLYVSGDATIAGKLTVGGLIDPTGLVLTPQVTAPIDNSIWVKNDANTGLVYTNSNSTEVFKAGEDSEPYLAIGSGYGPRGACRIPNDTYFTGTSGDGDSWHLVGVSGGTDIKVGDENASYNAGGNGASVIINGGEAVIPGGIGIYGGAGSGGSTVGGNIEIASGATDTRSGNIDIYSKNGTSTSGYLNLETGTANGGVSGEITINTGVNVNTGASGNITVETGLANAAASTSGNLDLLTGNASRDTGIISIGTGDVTFGGNAGSISISTGDVAAGNGGNITIKTGDGAGNSGSLSLIIGDGIGSSGPINITGGNNTVGPGGEIFLTAGDCSGFAPGGDVHILSGDARNTVGGNYGGDLTLGTGDGYLGGGDIFLDLGRGFASGAQETRMAMVQMIISSGPDVPYPDSGYRGYVNGGATVIFGSALSGFSAIDIYPT